MESDARVACDDSPQRLQQQSRSCESVFFSLDDLQMFGIQASQTDMIEDDRLQFEPCFFQPHPESVLEKYLIDPLNMDEDIKPLNLQPDYDAMFKEYSEVSTDTDEAIRYATERCKQDIELNMTDWLSPSHQKWQNISFYVVAENGRGLSRPVSDLALLGYYRGK